MMTYKIYAHFFFFVFRLTKTFLLLTALSCKVFNLYFCQDLVSEMRFGFLVQPESFKKISSGAVVC